MKLPFTDKYTPEQKPYRDKIKKLVKQITIKIMTRKDCKKEVAELEKMYDEYFMKFPNKEEYERCKERIKKIKMIM